MPSLLLMLMPAAASLHVVARRKAPSNFPVAQTKGAADYKSSDSSILRNDTQERFLTKYDPHQVVSCPLEIAQDFVPPS